MHSTHRPHRSTLTNAALVLAALSLLVVTTARAQGHGQRVHGDQHTRSAMKIMMHHLELTDVQRDEVHQAYKGHQHQMGSKAEAFHQAKDTLAQQIHADVFDEGAIRDAAAAAAVFEADLAVSRAELFHEIKQILTDEQLGQLHELMSEHATEHGGSGLHMENGSSGLHMRHPAPGDQ